MGSSLERVEALAFAGKLAQARTALAGSTGFEAQWLEAYLDHASGRFEQCLTISLGIAQESGDAALASRALITGASSLRQINRHLAARPLDESALRLAPDDTIRAHALIGLGSDAVGLGREREGAEHIDAAANLVAPGDWRVRVRLAWLRCEHAVLAGRIRKAVTHARDAVERSITAKAKRHEAKSLMLLGFCMRDVGDGQWTATVRRARDMAARIGAAPIAAAAEAGLSNAKHA